MPRKPRIVLPGYPHHVILRGNNKSAIFHEDADRYFFIECLKEAKEKTISKISSYCFMKNHAHFIIEPSNDKGISNMMQSLGRRYVRYINDKYRRTGTLWEGRHKSSLIDRDEYLLCCSRYIELNPVRAKLVQHPQDYKWSSFSFKVEGKANDLLDIDAMYMELGSTDKERQKNYREFVLEGIEKPAMEMITRAIEKDAVLGTKKFIDEVASLLNRDIKLRKRGRPKKSL